MTEAIRLLARTYTLRCPDGSQRSPSLREVLRQYASTVNVFRSRTKALHALFEAGFYATAPFAVLFVAQYATAGHLLALALMFYCMANIYNTVWYHRYCSHRSFHFSHPFFTKCFLWLNPFGYREEVYALNHTVHHNHPDEKQDPYGPHLGWLGTVLASSCELDTEISPAEYEKLKQRLDHIGFPFSSYESFRKWGSVESVGHYLARWSFATVTWGTFWMSVGGPGLLAAWYTAQFLFHVSARDFNYRGHGGGAKQVVHRDGWEFDRSSRALNQRFYGYLAGEWHNNHHAYRSSANAAFLPGQFDLPFQIIRLLKRLRVVSRYQDLRPRFVRRYLGGPERADVGRQQAHSVPVPTPH